MRCEDYPYCGHGPTPYGDDGGCPDAKGSFTCLLCGKRLAKDAPSAIRGGCVRRRQQRMYEGD